MKKTTQIKAMLFSIFLFVGSSGLFAQGSTTTYYHEKFEKFENGKGGNDGEWNFKSELLIPLTDDDISKLAKTADGSTWWFSKGYKGNKCLLIGNIDDKGQASTPELGLNGDAFLTFRAAAWKHGSENVKINIGTNNDAKLEMSDLTLVKGEFKEFSIKITGGTADTRIIFEGEKSQKSRFFLDEVLVTKEKPELKVATPVFNPPGGAPKKGVPIEISCATEGAKIYYTINGEDPTEDHTEYTKPIKQLKLSSYTIKARAFKSGFSPSNTAQANYEDDGPTPVDVTEIAELRGLGIGNEHSFGGSAIVSFHSKAQKVLYIEDTTGAILIKYEKGLMEDYETGTEISYLSGMLTNNNGMFELIAEGVESYTKPGARTPTEIELKDLTVAHQSKLVKVKNIKLQKEDGEVFKQGKNIKIEGSKIELSPQYEDLDCIGKPIPNNAQTIVAVVLVNNDKIQLVPRSMKEMTATGLARIPATSKLYSSEGKIHFEAKTGESVEIYNALGQLIYKTTAQGGLNTIDSPQGIIILKIGNATEKVIVK